jgi:ABC transporter substrate binding protein
MWERDVFRPRCRGRKRRRGSRARGQRKAAPRAAPPCNRQRPFFVAGENEAQAAARALGLEVVRFEIRRASDIASSFESLKDRADALYVVGDPLFNANRIRINTFTLSARLPTVYPFRELVEAGGLMSYGPNIPDLFRRAAGYVDKILRGRSRVAKAASISPMVVALRIIGRIEEHSNTTLPGTSPTNRYDITCLHPVRVPRASRRDELVAPPLQAERCFSAAEREMLAETFAHL